MTRIAPYDPQRFSSTIPHYMAGRPAYAPRLIERLARETGLSGSSRVLDLGCGPGSVTLPLARHAGTTIGMDPDAAMIAAAQPGRRGGRHCDRLARRLLLRSGLRPRAARPRNHRPRLPLDGSRGDAETARRACRARPAPWRWSTPSCTPSATTGGIRPSRTSARRMAASTSSITGARAGTGSSTSAC